MSTWRRLLHARAARFAVLAAALPICAALAVSGCGGTEEGVAEAGGRVVKATLGGGGEYTIKLDKGSIAAGEVRFEIKNDGELEHEFVVMRTTKAPDALPVSEGKVEEDLVISSEADIVEAEDIGSGTSTVLEGDLKAGKYVILCNLPGHYEQGMRTSFTVK